MGWGGGVRVSRVKGILKGGKGLVNPMSPY